MIANLQTPITHNDKALNGISRSRFSFHFNTARRRRWLLVQLVTAPAIPTTDEPELALPRTVSTPERNDYNHLINTFQANSIGTHFS